MSASHELVNVSGTRGGIPIARMRHVYRVDEVGRKLDKLPHKEHESLRSTYERMIELGSERFQVKPSGLPVMDHLYDDLPNFYEVLDDVKRQLALCEDSRDALEITPLLLLGPPGIGKTSLGLALVDRLERVSERFTRPALHLDHDERVGRGGERGGSRRRDACS